MNRIGAARFTIGFYHIYAGCVIILNCKVTTSFNVSEGMISQPITHGVVYTRPWVVELILDLAGYNPQTNLVDALAIEPAVGHGAFLIEMAGRLIASCRAQGRPDIDCHSSIIGYELDPISATQAREGIVGKLVGLNVKLDVAEQLANNWVRTNNYLFEFDESPNSSSLFKSHNSQFQLPPADFVIGNPPYIRLEAIPESDNVRYRKSFPTMKGRADIYVAFFEAALRQLKPGGVCAFICADRWMLNQYGAELRRFITTGYNVQTVIEMHGTQAFESEVDAYPAITVIKHQPQGKAIVASASIDAENISPSKLVSTLENLRSNGRSKIHEIGISACRTETWFKSSDPWPCTSPDRLALLKDLESRFALLESGSNNISVGIGVATGADSIYITDNPDLVEPDRLLPLALTSDIKSGTLQWSGNYLVNPWEADGLIDLARYPRTKHYFETHQEAIRRRNVSQRSSENWFRTIDRVNISLLERRKLYIPDIKNTIHPVLDYGKTYPHHNIYFLTSAGWDLEILGAILMSDIGRFFVECYGVRMRGGYLRMQAQYLRRIRLPDPNAISSHHRTQLTTAFRQRDADMATRIALEIYNIDRIPD